MIDLSSKSKFGDKINAILDEAIKSERSKEPPRHYLGGSEIGEECELMLQYRFFKTPPDADKGFSGRVYRIFERGHWVEDAAARWMRTADVRLLTTDEHGEQFGFSEMGGKFRGHCDGILIDGPEAFGPFPRLWENKGLGSKGWKAVQKNKVKKEKPVYFGQLQIYMRRFGLMDNPALFSAVNMDTMGILWEAVPYDNAEERKLTAKAKRILTACHMGEKLPKLSNDPTFFKCKWCDFQRRCHGLGGGI